MMVSGQIDSTSPPSDQGQKPHRGLGRPFLPDDPGRFLPGRSGNPGGRPTGVRRYIQHKCGGKNLRRLVDALYVLGLGTDAQRKSFFGEEVRVSARDRRECIRELLDRAIGRPQLVDDPTTTPPPEIIINIPVADDLPYRRVVNAVPMGNTNDGPTQ